MATEPAALQQGRELQQPVSASRGVPVGRGRDRRASLVIKETAQLLDGLHQDADRSNALMAELEQLLAASQQASQRLPIPTSDGAQVAQFSAVQPLQDDVSEDAEEEVEVQDEQQQPVEAPPQPVATPSQKRRSSVVTFDGSSLFAASPPISTPALGAQRSPSFSRTRALLPGGGKSFTEGHKVTMRRSSATDAGGGGGSSGGGVPMASMPGVIRRPSGNDGCEVFNATPFMQVRRTSALPYGSVVQVPSGQRSGGESRSGSVDGTFEACMIASAPAGSVAPSTPAVGGGRSLSTPSNGGGRFFKLIKGLFNSSHSQYSSHQLEGPPPREPSMPQGPGALSSMTFSPTAQQLRAPSRHTLSNPSITSRASGSPLIPTPPMEPPRGLQRPGTSSAAAAAAQGAGPGTVVVRSMSITSNGGLYNSVSSPTGSAGAVLSPTGSGPIGAALYGHSYHVLPPGGTVSVPLAVDCRLGALPSRKNLSVAAVPLPQM